MRSELVIRFDYGSIVPWVRRVDHARRRGRRPRRALPPHAGRGARRGHDHGVRVHRRAPASGCRSCSPGSRRTGRCPTRSTPSRRSTTTEEYWHEWARTLHPPRRLPRGGPPVAARAEGAHLRARPAASSPRRRPRCPSGSAACATGTTATAGCATPRSRWSRCSTPATATRPMPGGEWLLRAVAGDPGGRADHVRHRRRAAARRARARLAARATRARGRCGSATRPRRSSSSTSTAR